jgi:hypothetical protein
LRLAPPFAIVVANDLLNVCNEHPLGNWPPFRVSLSTRSAHWRVIGSFIHRPGNT